MESARIQKEAFQYSLSARRGTGRPGCEADDITV